MRKLDSGRVVLRTEWNRTGHCRLGLEEVVKAVEMIEVELKDWAGGWTCALEFLVVVSL